MITIRADKVALGKLQYKLNGLKHGYPVAEARAANKAARRVRTIVSREIRQRVSIKKQRLDKEISVRLANPKSPRPAARVTLSKQPRIPLKHFGARQTRDGVTYRIAKGGKRQLAPGAFGPNVRSVLNQHVYVRQEMFGPQNSNRKRRKDASPKTEGLFRVGRLPIRRLLGISAWGVFVKNDLMDDTLMQARDVMQQELVRQIDLLQRGVIK